MQYIVYFNTDYHRNGWPPEASMSLQFGYQMLPYIIDKESSLLSALELWEGIFFGQTWFNVLLELCLTVPNELHRCDNIHLIFKEFSTVKTNFDRFATF